MGVFVGSIHIGWARTHTGRNRSAGPKISLKNVGKRTLLSLQNRRSWVGVRHSPFPAQKVAMKAEINIPDQVLDEIADRVVATIKPMLARLEVPAREELMDAETLGSYLGGVSKDWIYQRTANNELPFIKVGHLVRFRQSEIDRWLSERSVPAVAPLSRPLPPPRLVAGKNPSRDIQSHGRRNKKCSETAG
jgi:excisionase family DNA binding protein